jgi:tetratricopeptide (TPR) repeat protein
MNLPGGAGDGTEPGSRVDRTYDLHGRMGEGGMGQIFRAVHLLDGRPVALKLVRIENEREAATREYRFALAREFQTLASLHHPNIIRVQSYGFDENRGPYFTMELLEDALTIVAAGVGRLESEKLELVAQLLRALTYLHRRGVLHRDLKPPNVLVSRGEVKVLDFGLALARHETANFAGTIDYMAPELLSGARPSVASDLYSVGLILYQLLTERGPPHFDDGTIGPHTTQSWPMAIQSTHFFEGDHAAPTVPSSEMALAAGDVQELAIDIPGPLGDVVRTLLQRRPEQRYRDAETALRALAAAAATPIPVETIQTRESFLQATALVGRRSEVAHLTAALTLARNGQGSVHLVGGESGVGKSRLCAELRTIALVDDGWVATGQAVKDGAKPYDEWKPLLRALCLRVEPTEDEASILADLLPDLPRLLGRSVPAARVATSPEEAQARIVATVVAMVRRLSKPMLLIFEDLQWARSESLVLLVRITQQVDSLPVLILGSYRYDEAPDLPKQLPGARPLILQRLQQGEIGELVSAMLGETEKKQDLVEYLERHTEGNVFFLVEILRALAESSGDLKSITDRALAEDLLTSGIEQFIERRLERVSASSRPLLLFAATLGRTLDLGALAHAFPAASLTAALMECGNAAVLECVGSDWRFTHDKLREAILRRLDPKQRQTLHCRVAEAFEAAYSERESLATTLAHHYAQAGLPERALPYQLRAGDESVRLCLYDEARHQFAQAQLALEQLPNGQPQRRMRVDLLLRRMQSTLRTEQLDVQLERYQQGLELLDSLHGESGPSDEDRLRRARLDCYRGHAHYYAGQAAEAIRYYQAVLPVAREFGDQELLMLPACMIGAGLVAQGNMGKADEVLSQAVAPLQRWGNTYDWTRGRLLRGVALVSTGRYHAGQKLMLEVLADVERLDRPALIALVNVALGPVYRFAGDWPRMLAAGTTGVENARRAGEQMHLYMGWNSEAWALAHLGRHEEAAAPRARAGELVRKMSGKLPYADWFEAGNAEQDFLAGRFREALEIARALVDKDKTTGVVLSRGIAERVQACALARLGADLAEVEEHLRESLRVLEGGLNVLDCAHTERWWGTILRERGQLAEGGVHLRRARAMFQDSECDHAVAELDGLLAQA